MTKLEAFGGLLSGDFITISKDKDTFEVEEGGSIVTPRGKGFVVKAMDEKGWKAFKRRDWTQSIGEDGILCTRTGDASKIFLVTSVNNKDNTYTYLDETFEMTTNSGTVRPITMSELSKYVLNDADLGTIEVTEYSDEESDDNAEVEEKDNVSSDSEVEVKVETEEPTEDETEDESKLQDKDDDDIEIENVAAKKAKPLERIGGQIAPDYILVHREKIQALGLPSELWSSFWKIYMRDEKGTEALISCDDETIIEDINECIKDNM